MIRRIIFIALASLLAVNCLASPPQPPDKEKFAQAIKECESSVTKEGNGRPDHKALDACMEAKGFTKPNGKPEPGGPPPEE